MKTIDKRFLQVPFLRLAEIVESGVKVPQAIRQMLKEMDHFVYKYPVQKDDSTLENWKAIINIPKLAVSSQQSQNA